MNLKSGVNSDDIHPAIWYAAGVCRQIYSHYGKRFTITSLRDGLHSTTSKHYSGEAMDLRTYHLTQLEGQLIYLEMKLTLDPLGFDIVDERAGKSHFHVEFDPKQGENWLTTTS